MCEKGDSDSEIAADLKSLHSLYVARGCGKELRCLMYKNKCDICSNPENYVEVQKK